jgi:hypothetical protein
LGAIMLIVLTTTLVTPPLLGRVARANTTDMFRVAPAGEDRHGDGGIDDLVAGASQAEPPDEQDRSTRAIRRR